MSSEKLASASALRYLLSTPEPDWAALGECARLRRVADHPLLERAEQCLLDNDKAGALSAVVEYEEERRKVRRVLAANAKAALKLLDGLSPEQLREALDRETRKTVIVAITRRLKQEV